MFKNKVTEAQPKDPSLKGTSLTGLCMTPAADVLLSCKN